MNRIPTPFLLVYVISTCVALISVGNGFTLGYFLGNGLMIPTLIYVIVKKYQQYDSPLLPQLVVALIFSFLGDLFMMIPTEESFFTLLAICTFMIAQLAYGILFWKSAKFKLFSKIPINKRIPEILVLMVMGIVFSQVYEFLGDYLIAGTIFLMISASTFLLGLNRRFSVSKVSYGLVMAGLIAFFLSDVLSALDLFYTNPQIHMVVILAYGIGHFSITNGILIQLENKRKREKAPSFGAFSTKIKNNN
ncbi:lysoplasmalogenase [Mongoliitalea daihaiensis]|uniref:lysoplasmalogenase n=1 Tax=Mongoliitalea daihaiensis TaxID=2782006 RepID=UPI001F2A576D|nr:lysoplasmalogenase [Mongoliitalea daihaiensis]UJP64811.1 lysoplasmalogenase [Mongoliitalea daihaiensis]